MILEIFPNEKNVIQYLSKVKQLHMDSNHVYFLNARGNYIGTSERISLNMKKVDFSKLKKEDIDIIKSSNKIIFHGLFYTLKELRCICKIVEKCSAKLVWVVWGGDFYNEYRKSHSIPGLLMISPVLKEHFRKQLIAQFKIIVSGCDYDAIKSVYRVNATQLEAQYPYKLIEGKMPLRNKSKDNLKIMVGHSATKSCRHISVLKSLEKYKERIGYIYCPLSYPKNHKYTKRVIKIGRQLFGDKFIPLTNFMTYEDYVEFLKKIDIGIFDNDRQQGMGNIVNLLYLGKKVFISEENTINKYFCAPEYYIFHVSSINDKTLCRLSEIEAKNNHQKIIIKFSDDQFRKKWERVYAC